MTYSADANSEDRVLWDSVQLAFWIAALTFTGSNEVGGLLRARLAHRNVRFQAELAA